MNFPVVESWTFQQLPLAANAARQSRLPSQRTRYVSNAGIIRLNQSRRRRLI